MKSKIQDSQPDKVRQSSLDNSTFYQDEDIEDPIKGDYRHALISVSTRSFSSARHSGATVVGITLRVPNIVYTVCPSEVPYDAAPEEVRH